MSDLSTDALGVPDSSPRDEFEQDEFDALATLASDDLSDAVYIGWDASDTNSLQLLEDDDDPQIYGLTDRIIEEEKLVEDTPAKKKSAVPVPVVVGLVLALIGCGGLIAYRHFSASAAKTPAETPKETTEEVVKEVEQPVVQQPVVEVLGTNEITALINNAMQYEGQSITIDPSRVVVAVKDGRVLVTHQLAEEDVPDAAILTRMAGIRANVLANMLVGKQVSPFTGGQGFDLVDVTWVVRNANGEAFIAVRDVPGDVRTSDQPYGVLAGSQGYTIAPEVLAALGADSGLTETSGTAPVDLDGNVIETTAKLATEESTTETTSSKKTDTTSSNSGSTTTVSYDDDDSDDSDSHSNSSSGSHSNSSSGSNSSSNTSQQTDTSSQTNVTPSTPTDSGSTDSGGTSGGTDSGSTDSGSTDSGSSDSGSTGGGDGSIDA